MSLLTGPEIARLVKAGQIKIEPFDPENVNPNSYNLRLCDKLLVYQKNHRLHRLYEDRERYYSELRVGGQWHPTPDPYPHGVLGAYQEPLDMAVEEPTVELTIPPTGMVLYPGVLYLGATLEYTETPGLAPKIDGRSSVGRLGLCVHVTAGFGDNFFSGDWTLELTVVQPLRIYAGVPICQIAYSELVGEQTAYKGKYQGQRGPKASGLWRDFLKKKQQS